MLVGDAMNTTARIEQVSRKTGHRVLVSRALITRARLPFDILGSSIGARQLRGKTERVVLFALRRAGEEPCLFRACA